MARVLWISTETPDKSGQGGQRRQYHQIRALIALGHRVDVLALDGEQNPASIAALTPTRRLGISILGRPLPVLVARFRRRILRADCDAVVVSHLDSSWLLPPGDALTVPILLDVHNVMSDWLLRRGEDEAAQAALAEEEAAARRFTALTTCSETERERFVAHHPAAADKTFAAPLGVDPAEWPEVEFSRERPVVALFGSWSWLPNTLGLEWFVREVWPAVHAAAPEARALVAGSGTGDVTGWPPGMEAVGRVPDLASFTAAATVVAVPVRLGVGAAVKFAESLASGAAVVATPDGANAFDESPAFVSDDPAAWASWIVERLAHRHEEPAPHAGRGFALTELTWANAVRPIDAWLTAVTS
ncbi:glycosyltransferase family 4 protein [Propionicicella superfundia]|uniref:glycosyltransferase family 4 protein n=1 Tax=Propionicicella superfundia TaxID=348582 RepID=UPI000413FCAB|nr:glycosyltransferase [Propionicicella superfundia]